MRVRIELEYDEEKKHLAELLPQVLTLDGLEIADYRSAKFLLIYLKSMIKSDTVLKKAPKK